MASKVTAEAWMCVSESRREVRMIDVDLVRRTSKELVALLDVGVFVRVPFRKHPFDDG